MVVLAMAASARADEWTKKYSLTGKPELRVATNDGDVEVKIGGDKAIDARVTTVGWRIAPEEVRIEEHQSGDRVEIEVRLPRTHWSTGHRSVRVELTVPHESNLDLHTGDGNIQMEGVKGDAHLTTGDGNVEARSLDGALEASSGDGNLHITGRFDRLLLKTGDGNVNAEAGAGSKTASDWNVRTGDGDVVLRLPEGFAAELDAHTGDGHIDLDFPVTVLGSIRNSQVRGKINGGGGMLTVHTGDGSIRLEKM